MDCPCNFFSLGNISITHHHTLCAANDTQYLRRHLVQSSTKCKEITQAPYISWHDGISLFNAFYPNFFAASGFIRFVNSTSLEGSIAYLSMLCLSELWRPLESNCYSRLFASESSLIGHCIRGSGWPRSLASFWLHTKKSPQMVSAALPALQAPSAAPSVLHHNQTTSHLNPIPRHPQVPSRVCQYYQSLPHIHNRIHCQSHS